MGDCSVVPNLKQDADILAPAPRRRCSIQAEVASMASPPSVYFWCEDCGGSGKKSAGTPCPRCKGTGKVAVWTAGKRRVPRYLTNLPLTVPFRERDLEGYCNQIAEDGLGASLPEPVTVGSVVLLQ